MLRRLRSPRGSVLVLVAVAMFPLTGMMAFAIDTSHWFDYSRNLQNRADAAALAAGDQYGNVCFLGSAGDVWTGAQSNVGKWGQYYAGPGSQSVDGTTAQGLAAGATNTNVPYTDASVAAATGAGVGVYRNQPNLKKGPLNQYYVRLNATNYYDKADPGSGTSPPPNFGMGDFCTSTPAPDVTDGGTSPGGPMVDVKVTQYQLGNFIPIFGALAPNIEGHARVQLQGEASSNNVRPIAVRDAGFTPCVEVQFVNASTNAPITVTQGGNQVTKVTLTKPANQNGTTVQWDNSTAPAAITIPSANVYIQPILSDCKGNNQTYDDSTNSGLLYINTPPSSNPAIANGQAPKLTSGGVTIGIGNCSPDGYFAFVSSGTCTAPISVYAEFAPNVAANKAHIRIVDHESTGVVGNPVDLTPQSYVAGAPVQWTGSITINPNDGIKQYEVTWEQNAGTVGVQNCGNGNNACTGTYGIQQQAFGACDGCDQPDDSGPVVFAELSQSGGGSLTNALPAGSNQNLVVTLKLTSLAASVWGDPAIILRFGSGQQSGLVDCGQGTGASADYDAILNGCGPSNPAFTPPLNPLFVNARNGDCTNPPWPNVNHQDCVQTTPGTRRVQIPQALVDHITKNGCSGAPNLWTSQQGKVDVDNDLRAITMIITSDVDLTLAHNGSQAWIPIWQFATFYVTGWDTQIKPVCSGPLGNESFPGGGKKNSQNAAVWGHWIKYTENGIGNGTSCTNTNTLGNCVPVLIR